MKNKFRILTILALIILGLYYYAQANSNQANYSDEYLERIYYTMPDHIFEAIALEAPYELVDDYKYFALEYLNYYKE